MAFACDDECECVGVRQASASVFNWQFRWNLNAAQKYRTEKLCEKYTIALSLETPRHPTHTTRVLSQIESQTYEISHAENEDA